MSPHSYVESERDVPKQAMLEIPGVEFPVEKHVPHTK